MAVAGDYGAGAGDEERPEEAGERWAEDHDSQGGLQGGFGGALDALRVPVVA